MDRYSCWSVRFLRSFQQYWQWGILPEGEVISRIVYQNNSLRCIFWVGKEGCWSNIWSCACSVIFSLSTLSWLWGSSGCGAVLQGRVSPGRRAETFRQELHPMVPKQEEQSRSGGNQGSRWSSLLDKLVVMDLVWSQARKASQQVSIAQGQAKASLQYRSGKDHAPGLSSKAAPEPGGGPQQGFSWLFFTQLFPSSCTQCYNHTMPEQILRTDSQSWRREEAAEPVGALSRLKLRKNKSGMNERPRPLKESLFLCVWRYITPVGQFSLQFRSSHCFFCHVKAGHLISYNR